MFHREVKSPLVPARGYEWKKEEEEVEEGRKRRGEEGEGGGGGEEEDKEYLKLVFCWYLGNCFERQKTQDLPSPSCDWIAP